MVTLAIEEEVRFVLLAGDLYDGDWKDYNTGLFFTERMGRLKQAPPQLALHRHCGLLYLLVALSIRDL